MSLILSGTDGLSDVDGSAATPAIRGTDANTGIFFPAADTIAFAEGGAEVARFDSSGNLGLGTASPISRLDVRAPAGELGRFAISNSGVGYLVITGGAATSEGLRLSYDNTDGSSNINNFFNAALKFSTNNTERMRLDSSGNLGLGVTPSAWTTVTGLQVKNASIYGSGNEGGLYANAYYNGGWKYIATAAATGYDSNASAGSHRWFSAASGTAGNAITFTTLSILDSNSLYAYVGVNPSSNGATNARIFNSSSGSGTVTLYVGNQTITTSSDVRLKENIVDTQRNALELVSQLRVVDHTWNDPSDQCENNRNSRGTWMGLIAQEAQPIIPWLVNKPTADVDENGDPQYWHMDYGYSVPLLVKAIQEQQAIITTLTARITALEGA